MEFSYPWLPLRCEVCEKWGHLEKACVMRKNERQGYSVDIFRVGLKRISR